MSNQTTIAKYILTRLKQIGVDHVFGVPGDFGLSFFDEIIASDLEYVGTCNELNAAYAADGYARIKGVGALAVTYTVGELSAINGVAGSFAEKVPVVTIVGCPSLESFKTQPLLHHTLGNYGIPRRMFDLITAASTLIESPERAPEEIDRVLCACLRYQQPVYIGLPTDLVNKTCNSPKGKLERSDIKTDEAALNEVIEESLNFLNRAKRPVIIADVELVRYRLQKEFSQLLDASGYPFATLMMGKTVIDEDHPQFIGLYQGSRSREYLRKRIEDADCILELGVFLSDFNTGGFSVKLDARKVIQASYDKVRISNHTYEQILLKDFITNLTKKIQKKDPKDLDIHPAVQGCIHRRTKEFKFEPNKPLIVNRVFDRISSFIPENSIVIAETGQSLFSAAETLMPRGTIFIGQIFFGSIGYTVGATLGVCTAAKNRPVILLIGDGSFQVTCQDLSTMIRTKTTPTIFLMNNEGYLIERVILDGLFNDLQQWKYHKLPEVFNGTGKSFDVHTESELEEAIKVAEKEFGKNLVFIEYHTAKLDASDGLKEAGKSMARANCIKPSEK